MSEIKLRPYQEECEKIIEEKGAGRYLIALTTGLGKTVVFSNIKRQGRVLILSHRDELVRQPQRYYSCSFGVEKADEHASDEEVISASVQTLSKDNRLNRFSPDEFDTIIVDEAHHAVAPTYQKILNHFSGARRVLGFTATPSRGDNVGLSSVFDEIIFARDLKWGIENGYLSHVRAIQVSANYDLSNVKKTAGDFNQGQMELAIENSEAIPVAAKAYVEECHNKGRHTLIYCVTTAICDSLLNTIQDILPEEEKDSVVVLTGTTDPDIRTSILENFKLGKVKCIINCMVLTEGTDLPICDAVINLRPTCNPSLYQQMVGRGTRLYPNKDYCLIVDLTPDAKSKTRNLCTAPTLFGIDPSFLTDKQKKRINENSDLLYLCNELNESYADETKKVELRIEELDLYIDEISKLIANNKGKSLEELYGNYTKIQEERMENDDDFDFRNLVVEVQANESKYYKIKPSWDEEIYISKPNILNDVIITLKNKLSKVYTGKMKLEAAIDFVRNYCELERRNYAYMWDENTRLEWSKSKITEKQMQKIFKEYEGSGISMFGVSQLNKLEASTLIDISQQIKDDESEKKKLTGMTEADIRSNEKKESPIEEIVAKINKKYKEINKRKSNAKRKLENHKDSIGYYYLMTAPLNADTKMKASDKQINYIESLLSFVKGDGNILPNVNTRKLNRMQASFLIDFLINIKRDIYFKRKFIDLEKILDELNNEKNKGKVLLIHYKLLD